MNDQEFKKHINYVVRRAKLNAANTSFFKYIWIKFFGQFYANIPFTDGSYVTVYQWRDDYYAVSYYHFALRA